MMEFQLRVYGIEPGRLDEFVREWGASILPLRSELGFSVMGPWIDPDGSRFVWLLGYDGDMREANDRYYRCDKRNAIVPDPARLITDLQEIWLQPIGVT